MKDLLGNRMKGYENVSRIYLPKRMPIIIRIDGAHFHTYTKGLVKPFDQDLAEVFWLTAQALGKEMTGAKLVYHQSDELSFLLTNNDKLGTQPWLDNGIEKLVSISASLATAYFNFYMNKRDKIKQLALFDSRVFVLPEDEVANYFIWRQQDATKNSISMIAQSQFKHRDLQGLNSNELQDKLFLDRGINWNNIPIWQKRGVCISRESYLKGTAVRHRWATDMNIPIFSKDRHYIEKWL